MNRKFGGLLTVIITACLCQAWFFTSFAYVFETEGIEISMNQDASQVLSELGKAESFYEADSCTHQGKERVFTYDGFELSTYPSGGGDYVKSVWFLGEETSTQEGIHIGSTIEEMQEAYGDDYMEEKGRYVYTSQDAVLTFYTKKGLVSGVEYKAIGE
ncbi:MAG: hypothetical protein HFG47_10300 [Lachnospiraceae bacterium]|nr:hypothetical protein [Lachnospiraceae bacterium]